MENGSHGYKGDAARAAIVHRYGGLAERYWARQALEQPAIYGDRTLRHDPYAAPYIGGHTTLDPVMAAEVAYGGLFSPFSVVGKGIGKGIAGVGKGVAGLGKGIGTGIVKGFVPNPKQRERALRKKARKKGKRQRQKESLQATREELREAPSNGYMMQSLIYPDIEPVEPYDGLFGGYGDDDFVNLEGDWDEDLDDDFDETGVDPDIDWDIDPWADPFEPSTDLTRRLHDESWWERQDLDDRSRTIRTQPLGLFHVRMI